LRTESNSIMLRKSCLAFFAVVMAIAQAPEEEIRTRQLWDTALQAKRPPAANSPAVKPPSSLVKGALVGITVWSLRPGKSGDGAGLRALVHEESSDQDWIPERVAARAPLAEGQRIRLSAESAQAGYLYIIDRDQYSDGTKGAPYLIFPTQRIRGGDNHVGPGIVTEIPSQDDKPPYFKVTRSRADQSSELLTLLITPKPIAELRIGRDRQKLSEEQVAVWEKQWRAKSYNLEDVAHEGKPYTVTEKMAARGGKVLSSDDPLPQTMYRVDSKAGQPVLLDVPLKIAQ
jgi:hypothetical protein